MSWPTTWNTATSWPVNQASTTVNTTAIVPNAVTNPVPTPGTITVNPAQYTAEQWASMQQQNWQQWMQWQQQYQQWQQQYGEQYQKSMSALQTAAQTTTTVVPPAILPTQALATAPVVAPVQPPLPVAPVAQPFATQPPLPFATTVAPPPPLPETKPPPPPEQQQTTTFNYSQPPPTMNMQSLNFNKPPPNVNTSMYSKPPPPIASNSGSQNDQTNKPPPSLLSLKVDKPAFDDPQSVHTKRKNSDDSYDESSPIKNPRLTTGGSWNSDNNQEKKDATPKKKSVNPNEITEAERKFDEQFKAWEEQFNKWKEQNANHPDKAQYKEYEAKWEAWRNQLLERREQMRRKRMGMTVSKSASKITPPGLTKSELLPTSNEKLETKKSEPKITILEDRLVVPENYDITEQNMQKFDSFNEPPKEQRKRRNRLLNDSMGSECSDLEMSKSQENLSTEETTPSNFEFLTKNDGGIPGLDLVEKEEENKENSNEKPKAPDYDAISRGINSILGDENLVNIISLVSKQKQGQADNFSTNKVSSGVPPNNLYQQDSNSFTSLQKPPPFDATREPPPFGIRQPGNFFPNNPDFNKPPPLFDAKGPPGNNFEYDQNQRNRPFDIPHTGPQSQELRSLFDNRSQYQNDNRFSGKNNYSDGLQSPSQLQRPPPVDNFINRDQRSNISQESHSQDKDMFNQFTSQNQNVDRGPFGSNKPPSLLDLNIIKPPTGGSPWNKNDSFNRFDKGSSDGFLNQEDDRRSSFQETDNAMPAFNQERDINIFNQDRAANKATFNQDNRGNNRQSFNNDRDTRPYGHDRDSNRPSFGLDRDINKPTFGQDKDIHGSPFGNDREDNRPPFGQDTGGIRPLFGQSRDVNRPPFGPDRDGNRPSFGQDREGNRPPFDQNRDSNKLPFGPNRGDNRASLGSGRDGNRPSFGQDREGNRPPFGLDREGNRPPFGHNIDGNRPLFEQDREGNRPPFFQGREGNRPPFAQESDSSVPPFGQDRDSNRPPFDQNRDSNRPPFGQDRDNNIPTFSPNRDINRPPFTQDRDINRPPFNQDRDVNRPPFNQDRDINRPPFNQDRDVNRPPFNQDRDVNRPPFNQDRDFNRPPFNQDRDFNRPLYNQDQGNIRSLFDNAGPMLNHGRDDNRVPPFNVDNGQMFNQDAIVPPEQNISQNIHLEDEKPRNVNDEILAPISVVDYNHKSLYQDDDIIFIEPVITIDYNHKSKNIPLNESTKTWRDRPDRYPHEAGRKFGSYDSRSWRQSPYDNRGRDAIPRGRNISPGPRGRNISPGPRSRNISPGPRGRNISPGPRGRNISPDSHDRNISPFPRGRNVSPGPRGRNVSPGPRSRNISPVPRGRNVSPGPYWKHYDDFETEKRFSNRRSYGSYEDTRNSPSIDRHDKKRLDNNRNSENEDSNPGVSESLFPAAATREIQNQFSTKSFKDNGKSFGDNFKKFSKWDDPLDNSPFNKNNTSKPTEKETSKSILQNVTLIDDLLSPPGRNARPHRIVIVLRGPPGSGKTFLAKLIKDKEVSQGGSAPRILSLDDYFMVEVEKDSTDPETGRKIKTKEMVYEYEQCMEIAYLSSLVKAFKKTISDGYFSFIIVDCVNNKIKQYEDMWSFAKQNGFQVYVCQMELDVASCTKRNIHGRTEEQIAELVDGWEQTPSHHLMIDATSLLQAACISEVEMDEVSDDDNIPEEAILNAENDEEETFDNEAIGYKSKWETMEHSFDKLARLDGINKPLRHSTQSMEDYLQLDDWKEPQQQPGRKRVRWADLVEKREQEKMRAIGFVVGQTDWNRMMDPSQGSNALTQTKFIESIRKY